MTAPRVDVRRLLLILLLGVMLPSTMLIDIALGTWPLLTLFCVMIALPVGTFFMSRAALHEMNKVIEVVAPPDDEERSVDAPSAEDASGDREPVVEVTDSQVEISSLNCPKYQRGK